MFHEAQPFQLLRTRLLVAIPPFGMTLLLIWQVVLGHRWSSHPLPNGHILGWGIFLWLVYIRLITVRLVTDVDGHEIRVAMRGLWRRRRIPLDQIQSASLVTYDAVRDFGGYGMRSGRYGSAYTAGGQRGVKLAMARGAQVIIGSARPEELLAAIQQSRGARRAP